MGEIRNIMEVWGVTQKVLKIFKKCIEIANAKLQRFNHFKIVKKSLRGFCQKYNNN